MSQILVLEQEHDLAQLHAELTKRFPTLRPKRKREGLVSPFTLSNTGDSVRIELPDSADLAAVQRAIQMHKPEPPLPEPPSPREEALAAAHEAVRSLNKDDPVRQALEHVLAAIDS